jgi:crotonobetainyl-CoA hydratase
MGETFKAFRDDEEPRVATSCRGGRFFCAGWDLKAAAEATQSMDRESEGFEGCMELALNKLVICAERTARLRWLSRDLILASDQATFCLPGILRTVADAASVRMSGPITYIC